MIGALIAAGRMANHWRPFAMRFLIGARPPANITKKIREPIVQIRFILSAWKRWTRCVERIELNRNHLWNEWDSHSVPGVWNERLGSMLLIAGLAAAVVLDPWSFSARDPAALAGSARMAARYAQGVVLAMGFL